METFAEVRKHMADRFELMTDEPFIVSFEYPIPDGERRQSIFLAEIQSSDGRRVLRVVGLVKGNTIRARHLGKDVMAVLRNLVGGEVSEYTKMMAESREQSLDRMVAVKVLCFPWMTDAVRQRFQREATAGARLHHDNIVTITPKTCHLVGHGFDSLC